VRYISLLYFAFAMVFLPASGFAQDIVHDAEYYILKIQNGERWATEDAALDKKLAELREKHGQSPNIVYILWDDQQVGAIGNAMVQKNMGFTTPALNSLAEEGINFTRMYTEPSCTPTRAAFLTGRIPVRHGMGVVGMPHEYAGLRGDEVTIAEVLSEAGYTTAHFGKGHLGDIEESYLHNQGFDEALFTPMNQIVSQWNEQGFAVNAALGLHPELAPPDPYRLDGPGLNPVGWVMTIEGKKGEQGKEFCGTSNECYAKLEDESESRTLDFIRRSAGAGKPFFVEYWPNWLNFMEPELPKNSENGGKVPGSYARLDAFVGQLIQELKGLGIAENTLVVAMADNGPMSHSPPPGWAMSEIFYRGGKGDFTEGGVRVPAIAWWPGVIEPGQLIGDIIHVTDLYTTFARLGGAIENIPTDRVVDGLDQTSLLLNGDTHGRRDYVHIYAGHELAASVKGRYKRHWIGAGDVAASGMPEAYYDLYQDPREMNPQLVPMIHTQGQFNKMYARHMLMKRKYPDKHNARGVPYTGLSNARPETIAIGKKMREFLDQVPFDEKEYLRFELDGSDSVGDWGK